MIGLYFVGNATREKGMQKESILSQNSRNLFFSNLWFKLKTKCEKFNLGHGMILIWLIYVEIKYIDNVSVETVLVSNNGAL